MPVPVATMITGVAGSLGRSITWPVGPVIMTSAPGLASHRKLEQMPFFAGSSAFFSVSQKVARRTQSVAVLPSNSSP